MAQLEIRSRHWAEEEWGLDDVYTLPAERGAAKQSIVNCNKDKGDRM